MITFFLIGAAIAQAAQSCTAPTLPALPEPHANNAVASLSMDGEEYLFSFMGLREKKTHGDISRSAYMLRVGDDSWQDIGPVPVPQGRLAATALSLAGRVWLIGGYSVQQDGTEKSEPELLAFDPVTKNFERRADMPVPVDDTVSFAYKDRYIYLVSGWHDVGNVSLVQVYDAATDRWHRATNFPGKPVFGHAGGVSNEGEIVISDGVAVVGVSDGRRQFATYAQGWRGRIDPNDPLEITWDKLPTLPGEPLYRMGAAFDAADNRLVFAGGSATAYNYDGIGYNGRPAQPSAHVFAWDFTNNNWVANADKATASMDHRGLVRAGGVLYTVGGMLDGQKVTGAVLPASGSGVCAQPDAE